MGNELPVSLTADLDFNFAAINANQGHDYTSAVPLALSVELELPDLLKRVTTGPEELYSGLVAGFHERFDSSKGRFMHTGALV